MTDLSTVLQSINLYRNNRKNSQIVGIKCIYKTKQTKGFRKPETEIYTSKKLLKQYKSQVFLNFDN